MTAMPRFYIAGCQRSGTTLMRLILESHSALTCFDETDSYRLLTQSSAEVIETELAGLDVAAVGFKIPRFAEQLLQEQMSDIDYGRFPTFYSGSPVVFLKRNVLDVVASMQALVYSDGESWMHKFGKKILMEKCESPAFCARYRDELSLLARREYREHLVGALYWKFKTEACDDYVAAGLPVLSVCYEDLVQHPADQLRRVTDFLQVAWEPGLLNHSAFPHRELDECGRATGNTDPKRQIHALSVGRHKSAFDDRCVEEMLSLAASTGGRA